MPGAAHPPLRRPPERCGRQPAGGSRERSRAGGVQTAAAARAACKRSTIARVAHRTSKGWWQSATISPPLNHPPSQGGTHLEHVVEALGADALDARAPGVHRHNLQRGGGSCGGRFWLEGSCGGTRACGVPGVGAQRLGRACKPHILTIGSQHPAPTLTISSSIPPPHPPPAPTQSQRPSARLLLAAPWQQHGSRRSRGRGRSSTHLDHQLIDV